jgi:hypothetical protein
MPRRLSQEEVIRRFSEVHGDVYDYSRVKYVSSSKKVDVICRVHGEFSIAAGHHMNGVGCKQCAFATLKISKSIFVKRSQGHFGSLYDYSMFSELPRFGEKVPIKCTKHRLCFEQEPRTHMRGHTGCPKCKSEIQTLKYVDIGFADADQEALNEPFLRKSRAVHGNKYDYSEVVYRNMVEKVSIGCENHGTFSQSPSNHVSGSGCPTCAKLSRKQGTFKQRCAEIGVNYWRALKRREAGMPEDKVFSEEYVWGDREIEAISVFGIEYPNYRAAARALDSPADASTIRRWIDGGMSPEEAFIRVPNPGVADGLIYLVTQKSTGKQYVGLTVQTLERRWTYQLEQAAQESIQHPGSLHQAIRCCGPQDFELEVLDSGVAKKDLEKKERKYIAELRTLTPNGLNLTAGGESGGSNKKPTVVDGQVFPGVREAAEHISRTRDISYEAAKGRLRSGRIDVKSPSPSGSAVSKTQAYKAWSSIVHGYCNPKASSFLPGVSCDPEWRNFDAFLRDVGQPPKPGMSFVRRDKAKGYCPDNCAWLSRSEAARMSALAGIKHRG